MTKLMMVLLLPLLVIPVGSATQEADRAAVKSAVEDYVKALYDAEPDRIRRSVHPAVEKLGTYRPAQGNEYRVPGKMTFEQLVDLAGGWNRDGKQGKDLDMTASVKLTAKWGIDYMHLIKRDGQWKIIQILWQSHPPGD